jgi:adenylosuccinate synthase
MLTAVIGAGFGDEGKGQTVSDLIKQGSKVDYVVRFNGGHQAGHTVEFNGLRHVFSSFGSGTLQGIPTFWSKYCTIYPTAIRNEYVALQKKGVTPVLYIHPFCPVATPWDVYSNRISAKHGTVGVGFGETLKRHEAFFKLTALDLKFPEVVETKLKLIEQFYYNTEFGPEFEAFIEFRSFLEDIRWLVRNETIKICNIKLTDNVLFEGAQGLLLDQDFGFFPYVTRSKTSAFNILEIIKEQNLDSNLSIEYVSRMYHTRHGDGPFTETTPEFKLKPGIVETNQYNKFQGEFRVAPLNLDLLYYAISCSELELDNAAIKHCINLNFTCADHIEGNEVIVRKKGEFKKLKKHEIR